MSAETYEAGVEHALGGLTMIEICRLLANISVSPDDPNPISTVIRIMDEEGEIDSGWVTDFSPDFAPDTPSMAGMIAVATLAELRVQRTPTTDEAAFRLYHRIIGVEVD